MDQDAVQVMDPEIDIQIRLKKSMPVFDQPGTAATPLRTAGIFLIHRYSSA
jgi:hypothetical protein